MYFSFFLLCIRFIATAIRAEDASVVPILLLSFGSIALAYWRPYAALFAIAVFSSMLVGLAQSALLDCASPLTILFSAASLGIATKYATAGRIWAALGETADVAASDNSAFSTSIIVLVVDLLMSAALLSLGFQAFRSLNRPEFWRVFLESPILGFGEQYYFLGSAFIWLQGLFYFRVLVAPDRMGIVRTIPVSEWIKPAMIAYTAVLFFSFFLQTFCHVPTAPRAFPFMVLGLSLPFEDSHAYGSIAAAIFAYWAANWPYTSRMRQICHSTILVFLAVLVVASWSRAAWLAAVIAILFLGIKRLPFKLGIALFAAIASTIITLDLTRNDSWNPFQNPFLYRLGNLIRLDQPRIDLYHKAIGMVRERPFFGHGIGASYLTSVHYTRPGDPMANVPDFMHNFLLQIATEQGLFVAAAYAWLIGSVLWQALRRTMLVRGQQFREHSPVLGAGIALTTYLITQMTANSLNVYISNQFFFWFLMAAVWCSAYPRSGRLSFTAQPT